jgi:crotonobetainyl-CoA:carnitine CoA-transferase CaiB-like acyl-CoA transferase
VQTPEDLANCAQLEAREFYEDVEHSVIGRIKVPFRLWNMGLGAATCRRTAPLLGQHNTEVFSEFGCSEAEIGKLRDRGIV